MNSYAAQRTCQDHLARDKDQQDNLWHLHPVYETWEQLWLILQAQHHVLHICTKADWQSVRDSCKDPWKRAVDCDGAQTHRMSQQRSSSRPCYDCLLCID